MTVQLVNVPDVPLVSTGTYQLASGEHTFTAEDLAAAVAAANDPTVPAPRLKIGHTDPRFEDLDGEPAFGTVGNMRLSEDGQTILGDYQDMPDWLAANIQAHYPGRSIEGGRGYVAPSGRRHGMVITNVALLGTTLPGVTSLADLRDVLAQNGTVAASGDSDVEERFQAATTSKAWDGSASRFSDSQYAASCVLDRAKCGDQWKNRPAKQRYSLPIREPSGDLNQNAVHAAAQRIASVQACPAAVSAAKATLRTAYSTLGETPPDSIKASAADIAAGVDLGLVRTLFVADLDAGRVPIANDCAAQGSWWARSVRAEDDGLCLIVDDDNGHLMRLPFIEQDGALQYGDPELVTQNFLPVAASASEDGHRVLAQWPVRAASRPSSATPEGTTMDVDTGLLRKRLGLSEDADDAAITEALNQEPPTTVETPEPPVAAAAGSLLIDEDTLAQLKADAEKGRAAAERLAREDRDQFITAAISKGKFSASRREHWQDAYDKDPEGARDAINGLAEGLVPGEEIGASGDQEGDLAAAGAAQGTGWFNFEDAEA